MFKKTIAVTALLLTFASAQAVEPKPTGPYIGGGVGTSVFEDDGAFGGFARDDTDTATMFFGGYKIFEYLAVEGRYSNFGTFDIGGLQFDATAVSVHAVGTVPFGTSGWELYGQLGLGTIEFDIPLAGEEDQSAVAGGFGIRFSPSPTFSIGIQTDVFVWEDESFARDYEMGVGSTALTARIIF